MPAKVTIRVTTGPLAGTSHEFDEPTSCIVGRAKDCNPRLPDHKDHNLVSRHHCLFDINPPDITVRDFASLNGTYVNGKKIGQRRADQTPEEGQQTMFPEHDLKDGDEVDLGGTVFRVGLYVPAICQECLSEIPESGRAAAARSLGAFVCDACWEKAEQEKRKPPAKAKPKVCAVCGRDVSKEMGENWQGDFVCSACKADPFRLIGRLLGLAGQGKPEVAAIRGYKILKELGRGGMGAVYLAEKEGTAERVALKVMLPHVAANKVSKEEFLREIDNTKALKHPNIVRLYESGCSNGTFFFTLEFCDGGSVDQLLARRGGRLPLDEALPIILEALDGLEYAHNVSVEVPIKYGGTRQVRGLVHRDIKPGNILLSGSGNGRIAKIGDYGLGKAFEAAGLSGRTRTGSAAGTPMFMPRQQVRNFKYAKPDVDVWAMAATLYYMLTGVLPRDFPMGKDPWQTVLQTKPVPIRKRDRSIPRGLAGVLDQALDDGGTLFFQSAYEFKQAIERAV